MQLTPKQQAAQEVLAGTATHNMLFGGSRSGKTFLLVRNVVYRALKAKGSRHGILRFRFNHVKASIILDTLPKVMSICFPGVTWHLDKTDWYVTLPNESQIWFGGLDDKERTEKILGQEYATIYLNECSQIPWDSRSMAVTRLAQKCEVQIDGKPAGILKLRMYYDCNPPIKSHWTYRLFVQGVDPETKKPMPDADNYVCFQINPEDNAVNLAENYLQTLRSLSGKMQRRFLLGEWADATPNQLFREEWFDKYRQVDGDLPDFVRIVVSVDPSGSDDVDNADNDEIGIAIAALGTNGKAYVLEDCSVKAGPKTWGDVTTSAYDRHEADIVVAEDNYGGAMVKHVIQASRPRTPYKSVKATRGKHVRAEPFSSLYEQGKVVHVGYFPELEDELTGFSTVGYTGTKSPNRADAVIWALAELFPALVTPRKTRPIIEDREILDPEVGY